MRIRVGLLSTLLCISMVAHGEVSRDHCEAQDPSIGFIADTDTPATETALDVEADEVVLERADTSVFTGNVKLHKNGQILTADRATYNDATEEVTADGNMRLQSGDIVMEADSGTWSLSADGGSLDDVTYFMRESRGRGEASRIALEGKEHAHLDDATYTTCPKGSNAWQLKASDVDLNHDSGVGVAKNVVVRVGGWPVLYTPYLSFSLNDERKSGFLAPSIGSSNKTGFDLSTPYYWNIAPDKDATLTPRWMSDRGLMLQGQYRYLYRQHKGQFDAAFLASDNGASDKGSANLFEDEDRKSFSWLHQGSFAQRWRASVDYNYVSDGEYLNDFGNNLSFASTTHLNRRLKVDYVGKHWKFESQLQGYQTLTAATSPYQRLPQFSLKGHFPKRAMGLTYDLRAAYVDFEHNTEVTGQRMYIEPAISLPYTTKSGFFKPRLAIRHTQYSLDDVATGVDTSPSHTLPILSVDSGLFFERDMVWRGKGFTQTLEPRAYYLHIPHRDQSDIPLFDTSDRTFKMGQLFSWNRFTGNDRIGDANQLSIGLTTRFLDQEDGRERLRLSVGQIQYFDSRRVNQSGDLVNRDSDSDMVVEVAAAIADEWTIRGELQWDPTGDNKQSNLETIQLHYRGDDGKLFNLSHRYRRDEQEQIDASISWPVTDNWRFIGRWYHSLQEDKTLETLVGLEYESCCWATRFVVRDYVNNVLDDDRSLAFFVQLELKGLGDIGNKADNILRNSVLGYGR